MSRNTVLAIILLLSFGLAQAKDAVWQKAVYWDARYATSWQGDSSATRDALVAAGYTLLNADQLKAWMTARIADQVLSVVVFCKDAAPDAVTETESSSCTLRKYLDAGGKIVWYADIPFYYQSNNAGVNTTWGDNGAPAILGFNTSGAPRDSGNTCTITPLGKTWGLTTTWTTQRPAAPSALLPADILAVDDAGNACAWVRHYVTGDKYRGFVRIHDTSGQPVVSDLRAVAEYVAVKACDPQPADGATGVTMGLLQWSPGPFVTWHDVYFGTNPNPGAAEHIARQAAQMNVNYQPTLNPGTTYYWRIDEIDADGTVYTGNVWSFTAMPATAWTPSPTDGAAYIAPSVALGWMGGMGALTHDVYFSADRAAVQSRAATAKVVSKQTTTSYSPPALERGKTYYWRVDENTVGGTAPGDVWSFTVRPLIAKTDPNMVGWWKMDDEECALAVDYSGYDNYGTIQGPKFVEGYLGDALSFNGSSDFVNCGNDASLTKVGSVSVATWIKLTSLGRDQKIASDQNGSTGGYKLGVYTDNRAEFEIRTAANAAVLNRTVAGGTTLLANTWYHIAGVYEKGKAIRTYVNGTLDRELLTADVIGISNGALMLGREAPSGEYWWSGLMDDVRVYNKALAAAEVQKAMRGDLLVAWNPQPAKGSILDIRSATSLQWSAGNSGAKHDVYLGKDKDAVKTADTTSPLYRGRQSGTSLSLAGVVDFGGGTYYWRVDEVEADGQTIHKGLVWNFTIPSYLVVDDFEAYNDTDHRIYDTWVDGMADSKSNSVVGYLAAPFAEQTIVHSGRQSMPLDFNNTKSPFFSEASQTFTAVQDWTGYGVTDLSLWFRGYPVSFADNGGNAYAVSGSGTDIWNNADGFRFAYKKLSGNGSITARVESLTNTNGWAKAGVMIRETLDAGSTHAMIVVTPSSGASFQRRLVTGGASANTDAAGITAPYWVRLTRTGNVFRAEVASDGKTWTQVGADTTVAMAVNVYLGLAVTAHNNMLISTAQFSNVAITGGVMGLWQTIGIGADPEPGNTPDRLYLAVEDSAGRNVMVTHPDPAATVTTAWTQWKIPLSSLAGVNLAQVKKLYLGVGDRGAPVTGGAGSLFLDDIQAIKQ